MKPRHRSSSRPILPLSKLTLACAAVVLAGSTARAAGTIYALPDGSQAPWQSAPWSVSGAASPNLFPNAAGDTAQFNGTAPASTSLDLAGGGAITVGSLLNLGTANWTILNGSASGLILDNTGGTGNAKISTSSTGNLAILPLVSLENTDLDISTGSGQTGTISLSSISGTGNISLSGASAAQTVITLTTVNSAGALSAAVSTAGFATTDFSVANVGDQVTGITVGSAANTNGGSLTISGTNLSTGPILIQGAGTLRTSSLGLNASATANGITFGPNGGTLAAQAAGGGITTAKAITLNGDGTFTTTASDAITLSGVISGTGGVFKKGPGSLTFSGAESNTYTGTTTLGGGTGGALSSFTSFAKTNGAIAIPGNLILDAGANGTSTGIGTAANTSHNQFGQQFGPNSVISFINSSASLHSYFSLYGNDLTVAGIDEPTAAGGIIQISQTEAFGIDATLTINNSAGFTFNGYLRDNSTTGTGKLSVTKTGVGLQALGGNLILYTGTTTINAGTLELTGTTGFNSSNVTFGTGSTGTLQLGSAVQIKNLSTADATANGAFIQNKANISTTLTVNQLVDGVFGGILRDNAGGNTLALTKTGAGMLTLTNTNTYSGNTLVNAGTLSISSDANLGGATSVLSVTGGATLQVTGTEMHNFSAGRFNAATFNGALDIADAANTFTLSEALSGSGNLIKMGAGTLVLSGTNALYTGNTSINEGTVRLGSSDSLNFLYLSFADTAPAGTKLQLNGFNATLGGPVNSGLASNSTATVVENGAATASTLTINSGVSNIFAGVIQDGGAGRLNFTKIGNSIFSLTNANTYTGVTTVGGGTLAVAQMADGGAASGIGASSSDAANLIIDGATLRYTGATASTDRSFNVSTAGATLDASGTGALTYSNPAAFGFNGQTGARTFTLGGTSTANNTYAGKITDNGAGSVTSLTKSGVGTWVLTNPASDYTGATTINGGGRLVVPNNLGATNVNIAGGTLAMGGNGTTTGVIGLAGGTNTVTLAGGPIPSSRGTLDLADGTLDTLTINSDAATTALTLGGATIGNASFLNFEAGAPGNADTLIIAAGKLLANAGGVQVNTTGLSGFGAGTYNLVTFGIGQASGLQNFYVGTTPNPAFSYSLDTSSGTSVRLVVSSTFTNSAWNGTGGAASWTDSSKWTGGVPFGTGATATLGNSITSASAISLDGNTTVGTLTIDNSNVYTISQGTGGSLFFNNNGLGATLTVPKGSPIISAPVILVDDTTAAVNGTSLTMSGVVGGNGVLKKTGTGGLILTGANTFSGGLSITGGTVTISTDANLGAVPATNNPTAFVIDGGTLRSTVTVQWANTRGITLGSGGAIFSSASGNLTIPAAIVDGVGAPGVLRIMGDSASGLYVPSGASTYSGGTILLSGTTVPTAGSSGPGGSPTSGPFGTGVLTLAGANMRASTSGTGVTIANPLVISADTTFIQGAAGSDHDLIFSGPVTLSGGTRTLTVNSSIASGSTGIQFLGAINDGGNAYGLIKAGTGTGALVLGGNNTFTGGLSIRAGTVIAQTNANALGGSGTGAVTLGNTSGADAATLIGAGALTFANPITVAAGSTGVSGIGSQGASPVVFSGPITLNKALTLSTVGTSSLTLSGAITGSSALTVAGATGFVQLSGANPAFTGSVTINSGILQIGNASALNANNAVTMVAGTLELNDLNVTIKSLSGAGTVNNKGPTAAVRTLTVGDSTDTAFSGAFTATTPANLALTKVGTGTLTLSGLSTYTGATTINGGTLLLDLSTNNTGVLKTSALTLGNGTLSIKGKTGAFTSTQTLGNLTLTAGTNNSIVIDANAGTGTGLTLGTWTRGAGSTLFVDISSTGSSLTSSPTLTNGILSYAAVKDATGTGFATVVGGKVVRAAENALLAASNSATTNFTTKVTDEAYSGGTLTMIVGAHATNSLSINSDPGEGTLDLAAQALSVASGSVLMSGANNYTIQNGTLGASGSNLLFMTYGAGTLILNNAVSGGAGSLVKVGTGTLRLGGTNTYTGATTINQGKLIVTGGSAIVDTGAVVLADKAGAVLQVDGSETVGAISGGGINGGDIVISEGQTFTTNNATANPTYSGTISGAGNFVKGGSSGGAGTNTLTLSGSNTYSGTTTINGGALRISNASALGNTGSVTTTTVANNARLELTGGITVTNEDLAITGTGNDNNGALQSLGGTTNTWAGNLAISGAQSRLGGGGNSTLIVSGVISGPAGASLLTRTADNISKVVLTNGSNTYAGATNVVVGILQIAGGDNRLPTATVLQMGNSSNSGQAFFDLNGFNQEVAGLTSLSSGPGAAPQMVMDISSATAATLTVNNAGANTYIGTISGAVALTKGGAGALTLSGPSSTANTYTGATTVNAGSLTAGAATAFSNASAFTLANVNGAALNLAGFNQTIGSLAGGGPTGGNVSLGSGTLSTNRDNTSTTYSGAISGSGGVIKEGTGALTLGGTSTYTGPTTVSAGSLIISGALSAMSTVTVSDGAVLAGSGTVADVIVNATTPGTSAGGAVDPGNGAATVAANGTVTGNATAGILTTGAFSLNSGAHLSLQLGGTAAGTYDQVNATSLMLAGDLQGSLLTAFTPTDGQLYFIAVQSGEAIAGTFGAFSNAAERSGILIGGQLFRITYAANWSGSDETSSFTGGNDVALMAIPEPSTWVTLLGSMGMALGLRRCRRKS